MRDGLSKPRINVDVDGEDVLVTFSWSCARLERPVYTGRADGHASIGLTKEDAHELHRQLGEKLDKQALADAGQPVDPETAAADWRGEAQHTIPPEREQEVVDAVAEQLQDFADAGHPDEEQLMAEAEARSGA